MEEQRMEKIKTHVGLDPNDSLKIEATDDIAYFYLGTVHIEEVPYASDRVYPKTPGRVMFENILPHVVRDRKGMELVEVPDGDSQCVMFLKIEKDRFIEFDNAVLAIMAFCYISATLYGEDELWPKGITPSEVESKDYPYWGVTLGQYCTINGMKIPMAMPYMKREDGQFVLVIPDMNPSIQPILEVVATTILNIDLIRAEQDPMTVFYPIKKNPYVSKEDL